MAKGAFVQRGLMILVCVARFTQVVAMEDGKSSARVHPTPDKYGTQQVQISMVIAYIEMIAMRLISCNEGCMDAKTCFPVLFGNPVRPCGRKMQMKASIENRKQDHMKKNVPDDSVICLSVM